VLSKQPIPLVGQVTEVMVAVNTHLLLECMY